MALCTLAGSEGGHQDIIVERRAFLDKTAVPSNDGANESFNRSACRYVRLFGDVRCY